MPIVDLSRNYTCRFGQPTVGRVDTAIFVRRYFMACMECTFCHDSCCRFGVDVDADNVARLERNAEGLEAYVGVPRSEWFTGTWKVDAEYPGGKATRTKLMDGSCVFRSRRGRGCLVHSYCLENGIDYHDLKPMVSALFPLTWDQGVLLSSEETRGVGDLVCLDQGVTLYRGVRDEVNYYFGPELVADLDALEAAPRARAAT